MDQIDWFKGAVQGRRCAALIRGRHSDGSRQNWSEINPSIMGTLFERGLDPRRGLNSERITPTPTSTLYYVNGRRGDPLSKW